MASESSTPEKKEELQDELKSEELEAISGGTGGFLVADSANYLAAGDQASIEENRAKAAAAYSYMITATNIGGA